MKLFRAEHAGSRGDPVAAHARRAGAGAARSPAPREGGGRGDHAGGSAPSWSCRASSARRCASGSRSEGPLRRARRASSSSGRSTGSISRTRAGIVHRDVKPANLFLVERCRGRARGAPRLRDRQARGRDASRRRPARTCSGRRATSRPSRSWAARSTRGPTCMPPASCSSKPSRASRRSSRKIADRDDARPPRGCTEAPRRARAGARRSSSASSGRRSRRRRATRWPSAAALRERAPRAAPRRRPRSLDGGAAATR